MRSARRRLLGATLAVAALVAAIPAAAAAAPPPPPRPPLLCSVKVIVETGADDLRAGSQFGIILLPKDENAGWTETALLRSNPPSMVPAYYLGNEGLPARSTRIFWLRPDRPRPDRCIQPETIGGVRVTTWASKDDWDLNRLTIADSVTGYRYWDQDGHGKRLVRLREADNLWVWESWHPFNGPWISVYNSPPPLSQRTNPPARPRHGACVLDVTIGSGDDDLDSASSYRVAVTVFNQARRYAETWNLVQQHDRQEWARGGIASHQVRTLRMTPVGPGGRTCPPAENLRALTIWRSEGDPFKWRDDWDLARVKVVDAANGYRYWDLGSANGRIARLDGSIEGWHSADPFDDTRGGLFGWNTSTS